MFNPFGHSPDGARIEMSGHILSAEGRRTGIQQQTIRHQATGPYPILFLPLASYLPLLSPLTSSPLPALRIPRAIKYQHLILLCFYWLPGFRSSVPPWTADGQNMVPTLQGHRACFHLLKPYTFHFPLRPFSPLYSSQSTPLGFAASILTFYKSQTV